eukprot:jgi/Chrpa1/22779/Chrysochromulina_OHIO_Genome00013480-RA
MSTRFSPSRRGSVSPSRDAAALLQAEDVIGSAVRMRWRAANAKLVKEIPRNKEGGKRATTGRLSAVMLELRSIFLPAGYPHSVRPEYLRFQCFDTLQAACSYLRSILTTSAILRGAGVGEESASPMAAAITWVLRDGVGMFGSLVFSYAVGAQFDVSVKEWRLFADLINDVGLTLDMFAPFGGPRGFVVIAALGAACKTICGMVAGATRASITAHFALQGNLADVSAKENAQETAVTLFGLIIGSAVAQRLGDSPLTAWLAFVILTSVHVWANVLGVGALVFDFLNPQRAYLVSRAWAAMGSWSSGGRWATSEERSRALLSPEPTARRERFWRPLALWWAGPRLGVGVGDLIELSVPDGGAQQLREVHAVFAEEEYLLRLDPRGRPCVALRPSASERTDPNLPFRLARMQVLTTAPLTPSCSHRCVRTNGSQSASALRHPGCRRHLPARWREHADGVARQAARQAVYRCLRPRSGGVGVRGVASGAPRGRRRRRPRSRRACCSGKVARILQ